MGIDVITAVIAVVIQTLAVLVAMTLVFRQMKQIRVQMYYSNMMALEKELADETKDLWGIPSDNQLDCGGRTITLDLRKLSYMVRFLDSYTCSRSQMPKRKRAKEYSENSLIYKMFENQVYRDYWKYFVKSRFYVGGPFEDALDRTLQRIESQT